MTTVCLVSDIERRLGQSDKLSRSELSHHFDQLTLACHRLQKFLADSIDFLSSFDVRKAQEVREQFGSAVQSVIVCA